MNKSYFKVTLFLLIILTFTGTALAADRFVNNGNGTVTDTQTGLMWAAMDNGSNVDWYGALRYCETYRGGGYRDWRMPTLDELAGLHDSSLTGYNVQCGSPYWVKLTNSIQITCGCIWASEKRGSDAAQFSFSGNGYRRWDRETIYYDNRALPVRNAK
jgi:hypothetical protein